MWDIKKVDKGLFALYINGEFEGFYHSYNEARSEYLYIMKGI